MPCAGCLKERDRAITAVRNGDAPGLTRALTAAARINAEKVMRLMPPGRWNRTPEPWRPPLVRHEQPRQ